MRVPSHVHTAGHTDREKAGCSIRRIEPMMIWAVAASAAAVTAVTIMILYRRQIREICRHLLFMKKQKTNMRLTSGLPFPELNELIDGINDIVDQSREIREDVWNNEA